MNKCIMLIILIISFCNVAYAQSNCKNQQDYLNTFFLRQKFYTLNYNFLDLTKEQSDKYETIIKSNNESYKTKLQTLDNEQKKLKTMQECNFTNSEIRNQKALINKIKKDLKVIENKEYKQIKEILTREQRSRFRTIKHLERFDRWRNSHEKNYYKSNPKMSKFGDLKK